MPRLVDKDLVPLWGNMPPSVSARVPNPPISERLGPLRFSAFAISLNKHIVVRSALRLVESPEVFDST
jgi:hypothetical protein